MPHLYFWGDAVAKLSVAQAAALIGKSKSTLLRAVKSGRVSASRDDAGALWLDPSELMRVYPDAASGAATPLPVTHHDAASDAALIASLREQLVQAEKRAAVASAVADERAAALADARRSLDDLRRLLPSPAPGSVQKWWRFWR